MPLSPAARVVAEPMAAAATARRAPLSVRRGTTRPTRARARCGAHTVRRGAESDRLRYALQCKRAASASMAFQFSGLLFFACADRVLSIASLVLREGMNPLGLAPERFLVAEDAATGAVVGCAQLKPFERLSDRQEGDVLGAIVRAAGLAPNWQGELLELASVVVANGARKQGIGTLLVQSLLDEAPRGATICALALRRTAPWYERLGFEVVGEQGEVPRPLMAEAAIGKVVARIVAEDELVVLRHSS